MRVVSIFLARRISSSRVSRGMVPICVRYMRIGSSMRFEPCSASAFSTAARISLSSRMSSSTSKSSGSGPSSSPRASPSAAFFFRLFFLISSSAAASAAADGCAEPPDESERPDLFGSSRWTFRLVWSGASKQT